ncbi:MAG: bifunctional phosphoglucose/phosphomannose isomerase [Patescibacteria group bacterium]
MRESIEKFSQQFLWDPVIENAENFRHQERVIVIGMGGSHLAADIVKAWKPELKLRVWSDYGLPHISETERENTLIIASSYSGNTEEVLDGYMIAQNLHIPLLVISTGGLLLEYARRDGTPYIQMPQTNIQPRMSLGFGVKAILKALGEERELKEISSLAVLLSLETVERVGKELAEKIKDRIPVIYASARNRAIAQIWKIKLNEGSKIPAFYNVFPELNHNEMIGFESAVGTQKLSEKFYFIILKDAEDHSSIARRMEITKNILEKNKHRVEIILMQKGTRFQTMFSSLLLADLVALYCAEMHHVDPEEILMIEDLKRRMRE